MEDRNMTLRKLFAWLMTLVMLLGMVPAAHAELAGCNHDWDSGKWLRGEPQNCLDWKPKTYTCTICGATATNEECGRCVAGPKTWVRPQGSNCEEYGVWEITCKYCGEWLDGGEEPGPHKWTTQTGRAPTCTESGYREIVCSVCGSEQGNPEEIPALGHDWGNWSWAHGSAPTCTEGAWQVRTCKRCGQMEDKWVPAGSHKWGPDTLITSATCIRYGVVGHTCTICGAKESWETDLGSHNWGDWKVSKPGDCVSNGEEKRVCSLCGEEQTRATGSGGHVWGAWKVTKPSTCVEYGREEQKCTRCGLTQWERVALIDHSFTEWYTVLLPAVGVPGLEERKCTMCGLTEERETPALDPETGKLEGDLDYVNGSVVPDNGDDHVNEYPPITLEKFIRNTPANGEYFVPGEVLNYALTLRIPDDLYIDDAAIYDPITGDNLPVISSGKGLWASMGIDVFHTVTEEDAARGYVENTAYATWFYQTTGEAGRCDSNTVTVPCGVEENGNYEPTFTKRVYNTPANGEFFVPGEKIEFEVSFNTNDSKGNTNEEDSVYDVWCYDPLTHGQNRIYHFDKAYSVGAYPTYIVTEEDAQRGYVENTAYVTFSYTEGGDTVRMDSNTVTAPCGPGELPDDYVPPVDDDIDDDGIPNEEDPDMDGDGIPNEEDPDTDGDGIPNEEDPDIDGDGIPNEEDPDYQPAAGLTVDMTYTNTPANGSFFTPGEVIDYLITVTNTGDVPLTNLQVGNSSSEAVVPSPTEIAPGQTIQAPYYKLVYEDDAKAGGINSYGHAQAFNGDPALPESLVSGRSADVFVPCGMGDGSPSVYYLKVVANAPANGLFFTKGETIKYRLSFGNNTKKDIYNITLNDPMANTRSVAFARRLKAGEFLMGEFEYVVTAADVEAGQIVNTATSTWATKAEGAQTTTPSNTVVTPCGSGVPSTGSTDAMLEKYVKNMPANGQYFVPGETIEYAVVFMNVTDHELHDVEVYDPLKGSNEDITISREPVVEANGTLHLSFRYVVTEEDAARGTVVNTASALWLNPEIEEWSSCDSNTVTTPVGPAVSNDVAIIKTIENAPANGVYFVPGEVIDFVITVQNSMDKTLDVVVLTDPLSADFYHELLDIPGGAMDSRTLSYTVTEMDAVIGNVTNYAHAVAYVDDKSISLTSNTVSAPCGFPDKDGDGQPDDPFGIHSALVVTKEVESLPLNGSYYTEGEKIAYKITYTNAGEVRLGETLVYDALFGMTEMASAEFLEPGGSRNAYFSYTVTAEDVTRGYVYNVAMATYDLGGHINTEFSNAVIVDTDGQPDPVPGGPDGSDPIPGVIPDPDQPNWGVIILPPEYQGEDCCKRTLLAWDGTSASYEETFCSVHSVTRNAVLKMLASASTLSAEQMAYDYAIALWKAEVEKQYEVLFQAADSLAQVNVINEYLLFRSQMSNYEALLRNIFSNQPARVSMLLCQEWQTKCLDLCYEMHTAPASRADSFFAVEQAETAAMKATKKCASIKDIELVKRLQYTDVTCTNHSFLFGMTSMLLDGENTAESWQLLYQMWQVEMNKVCNTLAANPASPQAAYAAAEQKLFDQWLAVRTNVLMALYPNNPEIAAEIATRTLMEHVADLCEVCK